MTVNERIIQALAPLGIYITPDFYGGGKEEYITFNYADDRAEDFGDNMSLHVVAYMQVHYFAPMEKNYLYVKKRIRKTLLTAGFTYPDVTDATFTDEGIRHLVFTCSIENENELLET